MSTKPVVAGTDGTDSSDAAVEWAAGEARRRCLPLRIVHACGGERPVTGLQVSTDRPAIARQVAEGIVTKASTRARTVAPNIGITTDIVTGHAVPRLLEASEGAELLVLGDQGRGGFTGLLLGSVSQRIAPRARCPVVVVRGRADTADGPIVAGVDDTPATDIALEQAFSAAAQFRCPIIVVRAYRPVVPLSPADVAPAAMHTPEQDVAERNRLEERLAPWHARFPGVPTETVLTDESASRALIEVARRARLVVVGIRGHSPLAGALGSAGLQLLHHAVGPILITRAATERRDLGPSE